MKQLFINGNATTLFFSAESNFVNVFEWVFESVLFSEDNLFNLNEKHSCSVTTTPQCEILISGDEDSIELTLEPIIPIL